MRGMLGFGVGDDDDDGVAGGGVGVACEDPGAEDPSLAFNGFADLGVGETAAAVFSAEKDALLCRSSGFLMASTPASTA